MSEGMNKVYLLGYLGADPELRQTNGGAVLKIRLATTETWLDKDKQERQERTEWHSVTVFGKRAEGLARLLTKGFKILVVGRVATHSYEKDGQKHYKTEVIASEIFLAGEARSARERGEDPHARPRAVHTNGAMAHAREMGTDDVVSVPF